MSKQSEAEEQQGYEPKPVKYVCGSCANFKFDMDCPAWMKDGKHDSYLTPGHQRPMNFRCNLGEFAVKKTATCREWEVIA